MFVGALIFVVLVVLSVLSLAFGVDSRDRMDDPRRSFYRHGIR